MNDGTKEDTIHCGTQLNIKLLKCEQRCILESIKTIILVSLTGSEHCVLGVETGTQEGTKAMMSRPCCSQMGRHTYCLNFTSPSAVSPAGPQHPTIQGLFLLNLTQFLPH